MATERLAEAHAPTSVGHDLADAPQLIDKSEHRAGEDDQALVSNLETVRVWGLRVSGNRFSKALDVISVTTPEPSSPPCHVAGVPQYNFCFVESY